MKLAAIRQIALGTVFATSLAGCASEETGSFQASTDHPLLMTAGNTAAPEVGTELAKARSERHSGDLATATRTVARLMLVAPEDPQVLGEYGKILIAEGRNREALAFLERALELNPGEWSLQSARGVAHDLMGDHLDAQAAYERALVLNPGEPTVLSNDAMSHMELGDLDTAEKLLTEASLSGSDPRIKQNLATIQGMKTMRGPVPGPLLEMTPASGQADVALQLTMPVIPDTSPEAEPASEAPVMITSPEVEPQVPATPPVESDQATRGLSVAYDPVLIEEEPAPAAVVEVPKQAAPIAAGMSAKVQAQHAQKAAASKTKKQPVTIAAKPTKAKVASKKPAAQSGPVQQTALSK